MSTFPPIRASRSRSKRFKPISSPIASLTIAQTADHLAGVIREFDTPLILIGHSFGGVLVQLLLARGLGTAGVAINSAPTEGVRTVPLSQVKSTFPILNNPAKRHRAAGFTPDQIHYAFTNTMSAEESAVIYDRYHIPAPGKSSGPAFSATLSPVTRRPGVDCNADRAPLLFIVRRHGPHHARGCEQNQRREVREIPGNN